MYFFTHLFSETVFTNTVVCARPWGEKVNKIGIYPRGSHILDGKTHKQVDNENVE